MRNLVILLAVVALVFIVHQTYKRNPQAGQQLLRKLLISAGIVILVGLTLSGRMSWLVAVIAAAIATLMRLLPLLKYAPIVKRWFDQGGASGANRSNVRSAYLHMTLDHNSGEMDGQVLQGQFSGKFLRDLDMNQLRQLLKECSDDNDSYALLQAYMDRVYEGWRDASDSGGDQSKPSGRMDEEEAWQILGLEKGASEEQIIAAHRRLMQKVHPDRGGSNYLAAKINLAKEFLLANI